MYRTLSKQNISYIGCAISYDGMCIDERIPTPIYTPHTKWEISSVSGRGYGCEDPRITRIEDTLYMCYTAFDGTLPRLALTSISVSDFIARRWEKWKDGIIISPPGIADKDGCLFPEKVNGKYAFFHRIEPNISIDFVDDLSFPEGVYLREKLSISPRSKTWDDVKIGINAPPLKTHAGWLVFYHGISRIDHNYRLGALLLDLQDLSHVVGRTIYPILEPEFPFEKQGVVNNVVFPCGYVEKGDELYLYYGGADTVICGAKINTEHLLDHLLKSAHKKYLI